MAEFEQALSQYRQLVIDMDGDGIPDAPAQQAMPQPTNAMLTGPSTADVMAHYQEPNQARNMMMRFVQPIAEFTAGQVMRDRRLVNDPAGEMRNRLSAAGAGAVSVPDDIARIFGQNIYGPETRGMLDEAMERDPQSAFAGAALVPFPASGVARGIAAAPRASTAGIAGAGVLAGSAKAGDTDYDSKRSNLMQQQQEAFQTMESMRRDLESIGERKRQEIMSQDPRSLQALVGAKVDGQIGPETRRKIDQYVANEVEKANRDAQARFNSLQARYDTLTSDIERLDAEESPAAIRERQKNSRFAELYPEATLAGQAALFGGGLLGDLIFRGRGRSAYNTAVRTANEGAAKSAAQAERLAGKGDVYGAQIEATKAGAFEDAAFAAKDHAGIIPWGTFTGAEAASFLPDMVDYGRSVAFNSPELHKKVLDGVIGDPETRAFPMEPALKRSAVMGLGGVVLGKAGKIGVGNFMSKETPRTNAMLKAIDDQVSGLTGSRAAAMADDIAIGTDATRRAQNAMLASMHQGGRGSQIGPTITRPPNTPAQPIQPAGVLPSGFSGTPPSSQVATVPAAPPANQPLQKSGSAGPPISGAGQTGAQVSRRSSSLPRKRKTEMLKTMSDGKLPDPTTQAEYDYIQDIMAQADRQAQSLGVSREQVISAWIDQLESGKKWRPFAIGGVGVMAATDSRGRELFRGEDGRFVSPGEQQ